VAARVSDLRALIHPSAWNRNSAKLNFVLTAFYEVRSIEEGRDPPSKVPAS